MADYAYTNLGLNGTFSEDGEYFTLSTELNGVPVRLFKLYVGDQRERFDEAKQNKQAPDQSGQGQ